MNTAISPLHERSRTVPLNTFEPDELFFSITDNRGAIEHANSVFTRLSGYTFDEMKGQPHNIVRDPAMPRGAFRLIWDEIAAGRPVATYVANRARSGARYEVFAVMLPTEDGYVSMRLNPESGGMRDTIFDIYDRARAVELVTEGGARAEAEAGAAFIREELARLGIADMSAFTRRTLPREVMATIEAVAELEHSAGREPLEVLPGKIRMVGRLLLSPLHSLETVDRASAQVHAFVNAPEARATLLADLGRVVKETTESLAWSATGGSGEGQELTEAAERASAQIHTADTSFKRAIATSAALREAVESLAENIGVFALQNQMIGRFAVELLGGSVAEPPGSSMRLLHQTLAERLGAMTAGITETNRLATSTPEVVSGANNALGAIERPLLQWLELAERAVVRQGAEASPAVADQLRQVRAELQQGFSWPEELSASVAELGRTDVKIEEMPLQATVKFIGIVAAEIE